jgi:N-acetylmuramoyl-L-alanine amidase
LFCASTEAAVRAFQCYRGLHVDGQCDENTWTALVEASWKLGDRLLFLTSPNLRGDDVAELQTQLGQLGFDCGRVDGILGPSTATALIDFQTNCGLPADGVCGSETVRTLERVSGFTGDGPNVSAVRERANLRSGPGSLASCRIVIGQFGGLSALTRTLTRELRLQGATVMPLDEPDPVTQALAANQFGAHVYLGFEGRADPAAVAYYYQVPTFESVGGRALAEAIVESVGELDDLAVTATGMRLPVLRETRMPAVLCAVGPVQAAANDAPRLIAGMLRALELWISRAT